MKTWKLTLMAMSMLFVLVVAAGLVRATMFVAMADATVCAPIVYDPNKVPHLWRIDPNAITGAHLLPPIPGNPDVWTARCGKWQRPPITACQVDNLPFSIEYVAGTSPASVIHDPNAGTWSFMAEIIEGPNLWRFRATTLMTVTSRAASKEYYVTLVGEKADANAPELH
jgi:hypothetical protein